MAEQSLLRRRTDRRKAGARGAVGTRSEFKGIA